MKSRLIAIGFGLFVLMGAAFSCTDETDVTLTIEERKQVSQRYADTVRHLSPIVDSLCEVNRDALINELADSLLRDRIADLERSRNRELK